MQRIERFWGYDLETVLDSIFCYKLPKRAPDFEPPPVSWPIIGCKGRQYISHYQILLDKLYSPITLYFYSNLNLTAIILSVCKYDFCFLHKRQVIPHPLTDRSAPLFLLY